MLTINLQDKLLKRNRQVVAKDDAILSKQAALDGEIVKLIDVQLLKADETYRNEKNELFKTLGLKYKINEAAAIEQRREKWGHLPQERIFTKEAIKSLCIEYGLRFLPTENYRGSLPVDLLDRMEDLKKLNRGELPGSREPMPTRANNWLVGWQELGADYQARLERWKESKPSPAFFIAAPAESFDLKPRPVDPLLFCALGDDLYYLVHKWGSDLSVFRSRKINLIARWMTGAVACVICLSAARFILHLAEVTDANLWGNALGIMASLPVLWAIHEFFDNRAPSPSLWDSPFSK